MNIDELKSQYHNLLPKLETFREKLASELSELLAQNAVQLAIPIETRVKTWDSISEKLDRKNIQLASILELPDLIGTRLIVPFLRDVESVRYLLESAFDIHDIEDKSDNMSESQFGYQSTHVGATLNESWCQIPSFKNCSEFVIEIQIRTLSQHTWAVVSHKLQYKQESLVPPQMKRSINRMSALLEIVDHEFERVVIERDELLQQASSAEPDDEPLTWDVYAEILDEYLPESNGRSKKSNDLIQLLHRTGISTRKLCVSLFETYREHAIQLETIMSQDDNIIELMNEVGRGRFYYASEGFVKHMLDFRAADLQAKQLQTTNPTGKIAR